MYSEKELVAVAKRENNNKRKYLVVNRKQGKHIPVSPGEALAMFHALADVLKKEYGDEMLLLIGFAETATAIGACAAVDLHSYYMQTTREAIPGVEYLYFSESHSHATEQKLVKDDIDNIIDRVDRIVFIEDEVTTGNTILSIITIMEKVYKRNISFSVASLLNGMNAEAEQKYLDRGIRLHCLVKTDHASYTERAEQYAGNGIYEAALTAGGKWEQGEPVQELFPSCYINARRLHRADDYREACKHMSDEVLSGFALNSGKRYLVLGTEEFMFPGLILAEEIEKKGCPVRFHATTRSPIAVSGEPEYPLQTRYELVSMYEEERRTFLYDLAEYDEVIIVCDSDIIPEKGRNTLINALRKCGNKKITMVRWH